MIHLHIKGEMRQVFEAAASRRIELTSIACRYKHGIAECFASTTHEFNRDVREWYHEEAQLVMGYGYPAGTLLHFSEDEIAA